MKEEAPKLQRGWRYRVFSQGFEDPLESTGELKGFTALGNDTALCMSVDIDGEEVLRFIPVDAVLAIELLERTKGKEEDKDDGDATRYFG